jgi:hypothetical protein
MKSQRERRLRRPKKKTLKKRKEMKAQMKERNRVDSDRVQEKNRPNVKNDQRKKKVKRNLLTEKKEHQNALLGNEDGVLTMKGTKGILSNHKRETTGNKPTEDENLRFTEDVNLRFTEDENLRFTEDVQVCLKKNPGVTVQNEGAAIFHKKNQVHRLNLAALLERFNLEIVIRDHPINKLQGSDCLDALSRLLKESTMNNKRRSQETGQLYQVLSRDHKRLAAVKVLREDAGHLDLPRGKKSR